MIPSASWHSDSSDTFSRLKNKCSAVEYAAIENTFGDQRWRLNNLYKITVTDSTGEGDARRQTMKMSWAQDRLYDNMWYRNIILKARQLGMTTFAQAYGLDLALFRPDTQVGIIAHTVEDAEAIFESKVKFMYDNLPKFLKDAIPYRTGNSREIYFANGSRIRVATSLRSGSLDMLHVSEFAKICAQGRKKAEEVIGGSLPTLAQYGLCVIESTAEGPIGRYNDMYWAANELDKAVRRGSEKRSPLDFKSFFFPCYEHPAYRIKDYKSVKLSSEAENYFEGLEESKGITCDPEFKAWYSRQMDVQGELMKQEYPNTPEEAFLRRTESSIFAKQVSDADEDGRITRLPVLRGAPVDVALDLGRNDATTMWFYQTHGGWVNFIRTFAHRFVDVMYYVDKLREFERIHNYSYGTIFLPHDGSHLRLDSVAGSTRDIFQKHGFRVRIVERPVRKNVSIDRARRAFSFCRFDEKECKDGIDALKAYAWKWDEVADIARDTPEHSPASDYADAFQTFAYRFQMPTERNAERKTDPNYMWTKWDELASKNHSSHYNPDTSHIVI